LDCKHMPAMMVHKKKKKKLSLNHKRRAATCTSPCGCEAVKNTR